MKCTKFIHIRRKRKKKFKSNSTQQFLIFMTFINLKNNSFLLFIQLCLILAVSAQPVKKAETQKTSEDFVKVQLQNDAIDLIRGIGKKSSDLTDVNQRIQLRFESAVVLWEYDSDAAFKLLEKAWLDTFSEGQRNEYINNSQRNKILNFASRVAPEKVEKWLKEITKKKTEEEKLEDKAKVFTQRQKADAILGTAIANLKSSPENAVSSAISSLSQTGKISSGFYPLVEILERQNRSDLVNNIYDSITNFTKNRTTLDGQDFLTIINLMTDNSVKTEIRYKLFDFLIASVRKIISTQSQNENLSRLSDEEILSIYQDLTFALKPLTANYMNNRVAVLDTLLKEFSVFVSPDKLADPLLNPDTIEQQIEDAKKTVGSKQRDDRFVKIASFLLSRREKNDVNSLDLLKDIADKITNLESKERLLDFITVREVEKFIEDENFSDAEAKARLIKTKELQSWTLMALGEIQKENPAISNQLYDDALSSLEKAFASNYKTQLSIILASLYGKNDEGKALEILTQTIKYSNQIKSEDKETDSKYPVIFFSDIGELNFTADDLDLKEISLDIPESLGKLAEKYWFAVEGLSQQLQPLNLRLEMQLLMAKSALRYVSKSNQK